MFAERKFYTIFLVFFIQSVSTTRRTRTTKNYPNNGNSSSDEEGCTSVTIEAMVHSSGGENPPRTVYGPGSRRKKLSISLDNESSDESEPIKTVHLSPFSTEMPFERSSVPDVDVNPKKPCLSLPFWQYFFDVCDFVLSRIRARFRADIRDRVVQQTANVSQG